METPSRSILIADDDSAVRGLFRRVLTNAGFNVTDVEDGRKAIEALSATPFDLLITDLSMPEQEGWETIQSARETNPDLKIVAISGFFTGEFLTMSKYMGADATLQKPIDPGVLVETVRNLLGCSASAGS